jgi:hypothetical protein
MELSENAPEFFPEAAWQRCIMGVEEVYRPFAELGIVVAQGFKTCQNSAKSSSMTRTAVFRPRPDWHLQSLLHKS